ncbi:(2Fe-2S)-binding protein [Streptomyces roseolilacinus]|uniref:(2Fe-2S)-binding protein n=1 Tax=Streptomyces roseolilacinus TaxID=66904 RepID=UPI0037FBC3B6
MTTDETGNEERARGGGWQPTPQGEYDGEATAFVHLPPDVGLDGIPLEAPGHGYVPPHIADPHATAQWNFQPAPDAEYPPAPGPAHLTGQWTIPVAQGELPEESGEYRMDTRQFGTAPGYAPEYGGPQPGYAPEPTPAHGTPMHGTPAHGTPIHGTPPYGTPVHGTPAHGTPVHGTPAYGPDHAPEPAHAPAPDHAPAPTHEAAASAPAAHAPAHPQAPEAAAPAPGPALGAPAWADGSSAPATLPGGAAAPWAVTPQQQHQAEAPYEPSAAPEDQTDAPAEAAPAQADGAPTVDAPATDGVPTADATDGDGTGAPATEPAPAPEAAPAADTPPADAAAPSDAPAPAPVDQPTSDQPTPDQAPTDPTVTDPAATDPAATDPAAEAAAPAPDGAGNDEHPHISYVLRVNGADRPVTDAWIGESLLYVLRERLGLAGAKDGCSQGECGACNVQVDGRLVASCLVPAATAAGSEVRTVEGLAADGEPSDVQRALTRCGAVQCGFCIPGMAMTVHDLLEGNHAPSDVEARQALSGNLCRCTGYQGALRAVREVVAERTAGKPGAAGAGTADQRNPEVRIPHQVPHPHDGGTA